MQIDIDADVPGSTLPVEGYCADVGTALAARGAPLADDQAPIWEGGLTPTPDGFHWRASV